MRRSTRVVHLGKLLIGGDHRVSVQGMTKTHTSHVAPTVEQINQMVLKGCDAVRVAVPREEDARAIGEIKRGIGDLPLVADIHFDHRLALAALKAGADGVRINPGNMKDMDAVAEVIDAAKKRDACIRIGVNSGSILPRDASGAPVPSPGLDLAKLMVDKTLEYVCFFEGRDFTNVKLSLKASDVPTTIRAYQLIAAECDYPLHLGVTAAGPPRASVVKSAAGIGALLAQGIGDTIRVSMTGSPVDEVITACDILHALDLRPPARPQIFSCPTCGRCDVDLVSIVEEVERKMPPGAPPITVAIMGCVVNGPGEAAEADVGLAAGKGFGFLFREGRKIRRVTEDEMVDALLDEIKRFRS